MPKRKDADILAELERGYTPESMCEGNPCVVGGAPVMFVLRCRHCGMTRARCLPCFIDAILRTQGEVVDDFQVFSATGQRVL